MPCFGSEKIRFFSFYLLTFICRSNCRNSAPNNIFIITHNPIHINSVFFNYPINFRTYSTIIDSGNADQIKFVCPEKHMLTW